MIPMIPLVTRHSSPATHRRSGFSVFQFFSGPDFRSRASSFIPSRSRSAFTLVELLVVIAIIVVLAGLGFSGVQGAMDSGRRAQARNDVHQVAAAVKAYQLEFGRLPQSGEVISSLTGGNPKNITFLEAKAAKNGKGGLVGTSRLVDPWGNDYEILLDDDYDNRVSYDGQEHLTTVVVYSKGDKRGAIANVK